MNFSHLKIGDPVIVYICIGKNLNFIGHVSKITKTQIIIKIGDIEFKFWKKNGREIGMGWYSRWIEEYTEEAANEIKEKRKRKLILQQIDNYNFRKLPTTELEKISHIINWNDKGKTK